MGCRAYYISTIIALIFAVSIAGTVPDVAAQTTGFDDAESIRQDTLHTFILIGDSGKPNLNGEDPVFNMLTYHLNALKSPKSTIFLGDNIYENGMPPDESHPERNISEARLKVALDVLNNTGSQAVFVPGNHDWRFGRAGVVAQQMYIENNSGPDVRILPEEGCPGPEYEIIEDKWLVLYLDTQWLLKEGNRAGVAAGQCEFQTMEEVMRDVERLVGEHPEKNLLVNAHHPLYSDGPHGGSFRLKDHLFPLTNLKPYLYLPLPFIGSVYPIYRKNGHTPQDRRSNEHQSYVGRLLEATEGAQVRFFAGGHEHSLSFYDEDDHYVIVSGSASKKSFVRGAAETEFSISEHGFGKLIAFTDGGTSLEFWVPQAGEPKGERLYKTYVPPPRFSPDEPDGNGRSFTTSEQDTVTVAAGTIYKAGPIKELIWGKHYRDTWVTSVDIPVIDLSKERGGLNIVHIGGGQQSVSVVVEDSTGRRSIMRSIQKNPAEALPSVLRETFARDVIQDQISASHPYGALIVSPLARAAGIYHPEPALGYLPNGNGVDLPGTSEGAPVLFEEFVSAEWFSEKYGTATAIHSSDAVWHRVRENPYNRIDEQQLIRTRLFDMLLGDWDRHDGQWFWAEQKTQKGSLFQPVPIDRDNAFFKSDGLIPTIASRKWALRKFQHFDDDIRDIAGINFNARHFDRWFLTELDKEEWLNVARELEQSLDNRTIEEAVSRWPAPVFELNGEETTSRLKVRRDKLEDFAGRYYDLLAEKRNVYGTEEEDHINVSLQCDGSINLTISSANGEYEMFARTFHPDETDEIRIFGFSSADRVEFTGEKAGPIKIYLIPGEGEDVLVNSLVNPESLKNTAIYDSENGYSVVGEAPFKKRISKNRSVHTYERESFEYDYTGPVLTGGFNQDDGVFIGGGATVIRQGFRKNPFARSHKLQVKHSLRSSAFSFISDNRFTDVVNKYDLLMDLKVLAPNYQANYFGLGNDTEVTGGERSFYRFRMDQVLATAALEKPITSISGLTFGANYSFYEPSATPNRFVSSPQAGLVAKNFKGHHFAGIFSKLSIKSADNPIVTRYGFSFESSVSANIGLNDRANSFVKLSTTGTLHYTFESLESTIGFRIGAETNIGDYNFFMANTLGGSSLLGDHGNLRGFMRDRFAGRTSFYQNSEVRTKLFNIQSYLFPASVGVLGFVDAGRVWLDSESSNDWHVGYGPGVWISPFRKAVISASYGISEDDKLLSVNVGFAF